MRLRTDVHSSLLRPLFSCVTCSPLNIRFEINRWLASTTSGEVLLSTFGDEVLKFTSLSLTVFSNGLKNFVSTVSFPLFFLRFFLAIIFFKNHVKPVLFLAYQRIFPVDCPFILVDFRKEGITFIWVGNFRQVNAVRLI